MKATVHFHLDDDEEPVIRKVWFHDLVQIPKGERSANPRRKLFESHLLTSPENQKKIREAHEVARKKEERANQKAKSIKDLLSENKKKTKVTCRADTVKAKELPTRPQSRERGRGRGQGSGRGSTDMPKL